MPIPTPRSHLSLTACVSARLSCRILYTSFGLGSPVARSPRKAFRDRPTTFQPPRPVLQGARSTAGERAVLRKGASWRLVQHLGRIQSVPAWPFLCRDPSPFSVWAARCLQPTRSHTAPKSWLLPPLHVRIPCASFGEVGPLLAAHVMHSWTSLTHSLPTRKGYLRTMA